MQKFWNWIHDDSDGRVLRLEGPIDPEDVWGDSITPQAFRDELYAEESDVTVWINSPSGDVFCAAEIYTMLRDYPGKVTVRIASIAASAASVVAMAGNPVQISPTGMLMLHDPATIAVGNTRDMEQAIATLNEVKESIINAYQYKSGLNRKKISQLMSDETWLNAKKAVELGFADEILFEGKAKPGQPGSGQEEPDDGPDETGGPDDEPDNGTDNGPEKEDSPDEEGEEGGKGKKKPLTLGNCVWAFSSRRMGEAILNRISTEGSVAGKEPGNGAPEHPEEGVKAGEAAADKPTAAGKPGDGDTPPEADTPPIIGMDGKTKDGAMPYEILKDRLECLR